MKRVDSFNKNVDRYESWFDLNRLAYESELEAIKDLLPRFGKGLEIGVGTGRFAAPLGLRFGLDPSNNMCKVASKRGIQVILGVGESLPFKDSSIDLILVVTTICFLDDVPGTLKEAYRILVDGGYILTGFIDRESSLGMLYESHKTESIYYRDATFLSTDEVVHHLKQTGFSDFLFHQTIFETPSGMKSVDSFRPGLEGGSFVVVRGLKRMQAEKGKHNGKGTLFYERT